MKAILLAALLASVATVAEAKDVRTAHREDGVTVSYADLDLAREPGAKVLLRRLEHAAGQVCGSRPGRAPISIVRAWRACRSQSLAAAVMQVDAPVLTALYQNRRPTRFAAT